MFDADLAAIRALSKVLPGALPVAINGVRVAASIRPRKLVIAGGDDRPVTMPRTAFQIVYPDCTVMLDSGLDKRTHDSFSPDKPEPYYADEFAKLERALAAARLIVLTHHHADHVAGVVTSRISPRSPPRPSSPPTWRIAW
jgi:glyoxylase-like metal-dependent hydrolase (beta-lactamase superfamily II)